MDMRFLKSIRHALNGLSAVLKTEPNFFVQAIIFLIMFSLGLFFRVNQTEWFAIVFSAALVLMLEIINTSIEKILDLLKPRLDDRVALIKDMMAGAVLLSALAALAIGLLIFIPYML